VGGGCWPKLKMSAEPPLIEALSAVALTDHPRYVSGWLMDAIHLACCGRCRFAVISYSHYFLPVVIGWRLLREPPRRSIIDHPSRMHPESASIRTARPDQPDPPHLVLVLWKRRAVGGVGVGVGGVPIVVGVAVLSPPPWEPEAQSTAPTRKCCEHSNPVETNPRAPSCMWWPGGRH
jgi:hypothetical protein